MDEAYQEAERIAEELRRECYSFLFNDCIVKSIRFVRACRRRGIKAQVVLTLGRARARLPLLARWATIPVIHAWGDVRGRRIEVSRPLGSSGMWGIVPRDIQPVVKLRL